MPEIAEVARVVHFLKLHLVGKKILQASAIDDSSVFGKVGTTGDDVAAALTGNKVTSAGSQGKYFWITLEKPPHLVMHLGMTGWVHIRGERSAYTNYYKKMKESEMDQWPPKFTKFELTTEGEPGTQVAFTDPRRFGRVRLVDCPGDDIRKHSPLVENGPDPVIDLDIFTLAYLEKRMKARHVPVKALLLDQTTISGIGNWVADETLYQAKLHPEQYSDDFSDEEIKKLFESIRHVCQTAVDKLGDSDEFPKHWLFDHRWGKGAKGSKLPNGEKLAHITVGGRTSCYAPAVQKKTGKVAPGVKSEMVESEEEDVKPAPKKKARKNARDIPVSKTEEDVSPPKKKAKTQKPDPETKVEAAKVEEDALIPGRRRSTRQRK